MNMPIEKIIETQRENAARSVKARLILDAIITKEKMVDNKQWIKSLALLVYENCKDAFDSEKCSAEATKNIIEKTIIGLKEYPINVYRIIFAVKSRCPEIAWLPDIFFTDLLAHLRDIANKKIENQSLNVCVLVAKEHSAFLKSQLAVNFIKSMFVIEDACQSGQNNDIVNFARLKILSRYYPLSNQKTSVFVYSDQRKFVGMYDIKKNGNEQPLTYEKMAGFTTDGETFVLFSEENKNCVRMFSGGKHVADYFLSETTGNWVLRFSEDIENFLKPLNLCSVTQNCLISDIINLSYKRIGAMLVFTNEPLVNGKDYKDSGVRFNKKIFLGEENCKNHLFEAASMDGAVLLKLENSAKAAKKAQIYKFGAILSTGSKHSKKCDDFNMGARHKTAACFSYSHKEALIVVISENRGISVFAGGEPLLFKDTVVS